MVANQVSVVEASQAGHCLVTASTRSCTMDAVRSKAKHPLSQQVTCRHIHTHTSRRVSVAVTLSHSLDTTAANARSEPPVRAHLKLPLNTHQALARGN